MIQREVQDNSISLGTVVSVDETTVSVKLDRAGIVTRVSVYGVFSLSVGDRVILVWDDTNGFWMVLSRPSSSGYTSGSSSIWGTSGFPSAPTSEGYLAYTSGHLAWVGSPSGIPSFLALSDTPVSWGSPGQKLTVNAYGNGLEFVSDNLNLSQYLIKSDVKVGYGILKTDEPTGNGFTLTVGIHNHSDETHGGTVSHTSLINTTSGDPHTQYASANGVGTRSGYISERVNKSVNALFGLSGGGSLSSSDISIQVDSSALADTNRGINVFPAKFGVDIAAVSGLGFAGGKLQIVDGIAGDGLSIANKILSVGPGNGILVQANNILVDQAASFAWGGSHTFTGTHRLYTSILFDQNRTISSDAGHIRISPFDTLYLSPVSGGVVLDGNVSILSDTYSPQLSGWKMTHDGQLDVRYIFANELHVKSFIADLEQALAGGQIISKSVAVLYEDFVIPAAGQASYLFVEDLPSALGSPVFVSGDMVGLRQFNRTGGSLIIGYCWGVVTGYTTISSGVQRWTLTRSIGTNSGAAQTGSYVFKGSLALDFGTSGNGYHEVNAIDGPNAINSPYSQVATWTGHPHSGTTVRTRMGNLLGITGVSEHGFWAGQNVTDKFIRISDVNIESRGMTMALYYDGTPRIRLDPTGPYIGIGDSVPTIFGAPGIWMGRHTDGTYRFSIDETGNQFLHWTYDSPNSRYTLELSGDIHIKNSPGVTGSNSLGGSITIDDFGKINMGTNSFFSMGTSSNFAAGVGSKFEIGFIGTGAYFGYVDGQLRLEGVVVVSDGSDIALAKYRPRYVNLEKPVSSITVDNYLSVVINGLVTMSNGNKYVVNSTGTLSRNITRSGATTWIMYAYKNGSGIYLAEPGRDAYGIDNPGSETYWNSEAGNLLDYFVERDSVFNASVQTNKIPIAYVRINSTYTDVVALSPVGDSGTTTIGHDFIRTPKLSALSSDIGEALAGSIVVGSTNKLWLNDDITHPTMALAIGGSDKSVAPFVVYENGSFIAGSVSKFINWNSTTGSLTIQGTLNADAGYLKDLSVTGLLSMSNNGTAKIRWNLDGVSGLYRSYIDSTKVVIADTTTQSRVHVGDSAKLAMIDITMFDSGPSAFLHGIHILDGGSSSTSVPSLFYGESNVPYGPSVDRMFMARSSNESFSDGFYGEMSSYLVWNNWDTNGVPFKGVQLGGGAVALFRQAPGAFSDAPVVWATSDQNTGRSIYRAAIGSTFQTAFDVVTNGSTSLTALNAGYGAIRKTRFMTMQNGMPPDVVDLWCTTFSFHQVVDMYGDVNQVWLVARTQNGTGAGQTKKGWKIQMTNDNSWLPTPEQNPWN